jgi:hypothetical protein
MTRPSEILTEAADRLRSWGRAEARAAELAKALDQMAGHATADPASGVILEIAAERRRQVEALGYTAERDNGYAKQELARAGAALAVADWIGPTGWLWPWSQWVFKPRTHRENVIRAAALLVAEVERLDRTESNRRAVDQPRREVSA